MIWVKRPAWILEGFPKDPYYSYGRQVFYLDRENFLMSRLKPHMFAVDNLLRWGK